MNKKLFVRLALILVSTWLFLIVIVFIANLRYKDHVIAFMKGYLDKYLQTEIRIPKNDIHFNLISNFPYASIDLNNILIKSPAGPDYSQFINPEKDTLLFAEKLSIMFNLWSLISNNFELKKIEAANAKLNLLTDFSGKDNYHIIKEPDENAPRDSVIFDLKSIHLKNVKFQYINKKPDMLLSGLIQNGNFSGSFEENDFNLKTNFKGSQISYISNNKIYIDNQSCSTKTDIERKNNQYLINSNDFILAGLKLNISTKWNTPKNYYEVLINCNSANLSNLNKSILKSFGVDDKKLPNKGTLKIKASLNGLTSNKIPAYSIEFKLIKAEFSDNQFKIPIEITFAQGKLSNIKNRKKTASYLRVDSLSIVFDKSIIYANGSIDNFVSPNLKSQLWGELNMEKLTQSGNLINSFELKGIVKFSLVASGNLTSLNSFKTEYLRKLTFDGKFTFTDLMINSLTNALPPLIATGEIDLNPMKQIDIKKLLIKTGASDLSISGTVLNIPLFTTDQKMIPEYQCNIQSEEFHFDDFIFKEKSSTPKKVSFPDSIKVLANFKAKHFSFGKFEATDASGEIDYSPKTLALRDFYLKSQEGIIHSSIIVNQRDEFFITTCKANLVYLDINNLFYAFNNFGQTVISSENLSGRLSAPVYVTATWDTYLNPVYDKLILESEVEINNGKIINYSPLLGLAKYIKVDELKNIRFDQLKITISIKDKTVFISQTDIHSTAMNLTGSGEHYFDNSYIYRLQVQLSDVLWNKANKKKPENTEFGYVVDDGLGRTTLPLVIRGKGTEYNVNYDKRTAGGILKEKFKRERQELKHIFAAEDSMKINFDAEQKEQIIWEENENKTEIIKDKTKTENGKEKNEFPVEWEDN